MAAEAQSRDFYAASRRAFVADGQAYNWSIHRGHFKDFVPIVDLLHVVCYLFKAAHAAGVRAAVHTFSEEGVEVMVRAGVDSVEHGTGLTLDLIDEMARRGTALVPTMINIRTFGKIADQARERFAGYADHMIALRDTPSAHAACPQPVSGSTPNRYM